jgi:3',5'-cyclic AMP phosphodiesterase CpdA
MTLAHLSDPHISYMNAITARDLLGKRLFGYLRWKLHRGAKHGDSVLSALQADLAKTKPDHIAVTGDLTHLSLSAEFKKSRQWLQLLGPPSQVTVIPGNHDTYVNTDWYKTMAYWTEYMLSDTPRDDDHNLKNMDRIFPCLRIRGRVAIIGVCTAQPSAPHLAVGSIGTLQLHRLEKILSQTARQKYFRVVLIHHPPVSGTVSWRKRLTDAPAASRPLWGGADLARPCASCAPRLSEDSVRLCPGYGCSIDHGPGPPTGASRPLLPLPYFAWRRRLERQTSSTHLLN